MRMLRAIAPLILFAPVPAGAQSAVQDSNTIHVEGSLARRDNKPIAMSSWRVAETDHVLVYSAGEEKQLVRVAHNLEKLHFLLSMLLNRVDEPDDTVKLRVTLIGDIVDFNKLDLKSVRWQRGPYPRAFPTQLYYDPREDGAVLATTTVDQKVELQVGRDIRSVLDQLIPSDTGGMTTTFSYPGAPIGFDPSLGEVKFDLTADSRIYAAFAQHYLLTYFPAAYPRWYLDGWGEIFSTMVADKPGVIEYGQQPEGYRKMLQWYGRYPLPKVLDGTYLTDRKRRPRWTPVNAWALVHLLFFSEEWKQPLHNYLAAVARGEAPARAAKQLDLRKLETQLSTYFGPKVPYEQMIFPPERAAAPLVRQLTRSEAAYVKGRLELGARLDLPPPPPPGADAETAKAMSDDRADAIRRRDAWIADQREAAARYSEDLELQLLLAEIECRAGNAEACLAAADRVLAKDPDRSPALAWKGIALTRLAIAGPEAERPAKLHEARGFIVRANRIDTEAVLPLIAYYRSYADAGEPAPDAAVLGLIKVNERAPGSPVVELMLGSELARRGDEAGARRVLRPIADGAYDTPERDRARAILASLGR